MIIVLAHRDKIGGAYAIPLSSATGPCYHFFFSRSNIYILTGSTCNFTKLALMVHVRIRNFLTILDAKSDADI